MQRLGWRVRCRDKRFNPRPAFRPGDAIANPIPTISPYSFNPRPAFRPGDATLALKVTLVIVLFQSAPGLSAGRCCAGQHFLLVVDLVSIRARPFGRAMPGLVRARPADYCRFNPRPAFRPGDAVIHPLPKKQALVSIRARPFGRAMQDGPWTTAGIFPFQSAPGLSAGRCRADFRSVREWFVVSIRARPFGRAMLEKPENIPAALDVSIRARPFGRAMHGAAGGFLRRKSVSIRARPFGRAMRRACGFRCRRRTGFNPRPAFRPGDARPVSRPSQALWRFNPRPAFRPGDALSAGAVDLEFVVSIRARPFGRAMLYAALALAAFVVWFQSAPGLSAGRCRRSPARLRA